MSTGITETPVYGFRARCRDCGWAGPDRGYGSTDGGGWDAAADDADEHTCAAVPEGTEA